VQLQCGFLSDNKVGDESRNGGERFIWWENIFQPTAATIRCVMIEVVILSFPSRLFVDVV
jgi:hypothetical protein